MYAKWDLKCTLACALKEKRHEVKPLQLQILFSKVFEGKNSSAFKGGHQWRMQNVTDGWAWIKSRWAWIYGCSEIKAGFPDNVVS